MGAPVGPTGCNRPAPKGEHDVQEEGSAWQIAASYGQTWSHLHFDDDYEPVFNQHAVVASGGYFFPNGWNLSLSAGAILGGEITGDGERYDIRPGAVVSFRVGWRWLAEDGAVPFLNSSVALSFSYSSSEDSVGETDTIIATDARFALTVGYTLFDVWQLYLSPRGFGGPIFWRHGGESVRGRDRYFFQAGLGTAILLPAGFTVFADGSFLGEQAVSAGAAFAF